MSSSPLQDALGRRIDYLRVSLTDRCNFRCRYCMPPGGVHKLSHAEMLSLEELAEVIGVMVADLGIRKVRVTGGEPLVRRGAIGFLEEIGRLTEIRDLSMTTNAYLLSDVADEIRAAGVARINISLDTLRRERFARFTGVDGLAQVLAGIEAARRAGFSPIKLNMVIMRDNLDEAGDMLRFALERTLEVRFIELMPGPGKSEGQFVPAEEALRMLQGPFDLQPFRSRDDPHCAARLYEIGATGRVCGFITPVSLPFCAGCNRVRLRGDGHLMPCLSEETSFDLKPYVRPAVRGAEMTEFLRRILSASKGTLPDRRRIQGMWRIGG